MDSETDDLYFSVGVKPGVSLLNETEAKKIAQLSQRILSSMPVKDSLVIFNNDEKETLVAALGYHSRSDFNMVIGTLVELWQQITFKQLKADQLSCALRNLGFSDENNAVIVEIWSQLRQGVTDRLCDASFSGIPQLLDVNWTLRVDVASKDFLKKRFPKVVLELVTDDGLKHVAMSREELIGLFSTLQEVQEKLDSLLQ